MKTHYLSLFAIILFIGGCCKCPPATTSTTTAATLTGTVSGQPTSALTVPGVTGPAAGNITLTMTPLGTPPACNPIHVFVYFIGTTPGTVQSVTINGGAMNFVYTDQATTGATQVTAGTWGSPPAVLSNTTGNPMTATIQATVGGKPYSAVVNGPQLTSPPDNKTGLDITTYSDGAGHQAVVVVEDAAIMM
jgi:hypothetical protein